MASGHGVSGGPGRCYSFWVEFTKCVGKFASRLYFLSVCSLSLFVYSAMHVHFEIFSFGLLTLYKYATVCFRNKGESLFPRDCDDYREDYIECLHHPKEAKRRRAISEQVKRNQEMEKEAGQVEAGANTTQPPSG